MTTISYKDGTLAADSQVSAGNLICNNDFNKVMRFDSNEFGSVYIGAAGTLSHICEMFEFIEQLFAGEQPDAIKFASDQFQVVMLTEDGKLKEGLLTEASTNILWVDCESPWAIGSGSQIAIGAMSQGASAEEAVKIAAKHDCYTNDNVKVYKASDLSYVNLLKDQRDAINEQIEMMESEECYEEPSKDCSDVREDKMKTLNAPTAISDMIDNVRQRFYKEEEPCTIPSDIIENPPEGTFEDNVNACSGDCKSCSEASIERAEIGVKYDWDGSKDFPDNLREGDTVTVYFAKGAIMANDCPESWYWEHDGNHNRGDIIAYTCLAHAEDC
jgi:ATP-dependent protease HslVU (ClpYQ) peptidase subunit